MDETGTEGASYIRGPRQRSAARVRDVTTNNENTVQICIPGLTQYISVARHAVDALGEQIHLSPDDRAAVNLAVGEACNNAVLHAPDVGGAADPDCPVGAVCVACRVDDDALEIDVSNNGNGFHPPLDAAMPDAFAEHGRGMPLMELLMDSVEYLSLRGNTVVRMRKRRHPLPA